MEFKYELKGEDGSELFEEGVVLAWQYLGVGFGTWDMRPNRGETAHYVLPERNGVSWRSAPGSRSTCSGQG
jgi:hypothetical protein